MKKSMKQSTLTFLLNTASILLIALSSIAFSFIVDSNNNVDKANSSRYALIQNAKRFMDGSAYLTSEVRAYAATGDKAHYDHYWAEVKKLKNRDIGISNMKKIGITKQEQALVEEMASLSDNLIPLEEEAMLLVEAGKTSEALEAVYGTIYEDWISHIRTAQTNFTKELDARTDLEVESLRKIARDWTIITVICLAITALLQVISNIIFYRKIIRPIILVRDEMIQIEHGNLHSDFGATADTSEIGSLIGSIQSTKSELNKYISDISQKLTAIANGDLDTRVEIDYIGDFAEIKETINEIAQILADQHERDMRRHEELLGAYEAANAANRAKSNFLSSMSHEIRTPLNAIIGMTNIAQASPDVDKKDYCLNKIIDASTHLLGIINDILDMSKIDANKFELSPSEFNFERMVVKVVNIINFRADEKQQRLRVKIDSNVPKAIISDEQRLSQVLTNLLSNAVKFTPEHGAIEVGVSMEEETEQDCVLRISVKDNGIGISIEQQEKLFSSFTQADAGISRKFGGTGLGLAISKSIVEKMDGRIWIESELGEGAAFVFLIRAGKGSDNVGLDPELTNIKWDQLRVLAVDDDPAIREYFQKVADEIGFICEVAADGPAACEIIERSGAFDIYFVDWKMPGMTGIELVRRIQDFSSAYAATIMISSAEWKSIEVEATEAGVNQFLAKPLVSSVITDTITKYLGSEPHLHQMGASEGLPDFSSYHILLAEDVEINREIVLALLEPTGIHITCAENGAEVVEAMADQTRHFDFIFMDIHMPEVDGHEATRRIRAMDSAYAKDIPIIAMTANVFREDVERCLAVGMNGHIGKPINFNDVIEVLEKYLAGK